MSKQEPRIENGKELLLAGLQKHYTFETRTEIPQLWHKFGPMIGSIPGQVGFVAYGIIYEFADYGFRYMAAVEVSEASSLPEGFETITFPAQRYAVFTHEGHVDTLCDTISFIFEEWFPKAGVEADGSIGHFERYGEEFDPVAGSGDLELWVPLKN